jgi:hypothetical protein
MNQLPQTEKQMGKRIVSKGEYAKRQGRRLKLCFAFVIAVIWLPVFLWYCGNSHIRSGSEYVEFFVIASLCFMPFSMLCGLLAFRRALEIDPGVPLTRANTADILAPDSLVRASAEPVQQQQAVLLRAATEGVERHKEQLVRAAGKADG